MERVNRIIKNSTYKEAMYKNNLWEQKRIYCCHDFNHQLDVARIAYIFVLEKGLSIQKEIIYAIALLHDIGRFMQYEKQMDHEEASASLSQNILRECGFSEDETATIVRCILRHRQDAGDVANSELEDIIYRADKLSRNCFICDASSSCNWSPDKKNSNIII